MRVVGSTIGRTAGFAANFYVALNFGFRTGRSQRRLALTSVEREGDHLASGARRQKRSIVRRGRVVARRQIANVRNGQISARRPVAVVAQSREDAVDDGRLGTDNVARFVVAMSVSIAEVL